MSTPQTCVTSQSSLCSEKAGENIKTHHCTASYIAVTCVLSVNVTSLNNQPARTTRALISVQAMLPWSDRGFVPVQNNCDVVVNASKEHKTSMVLKNAALFDAMRPKFRQF